MHLHPAGRLSAAELGVNRRGRIAHWDMGKRRIRYLKEHYRILYYNLLTACKLNSYLSNINKLAEEMFSRLVKQMAERKDVTEALKAEGGMKMVQAMNNIRNCAEEIVISDIINN